MQCSLGTTRKLRAGERRGTLEAGARGTPAQVTGRGHQPPPWAPPQPPRAPLCIPYLFLRLRDRAEREEAKEAIFLFNRFALLALGGINASGVEHTP